MEYSSKTNDSDEIPDITAMIVKKEKRKREPHKLVIINEEELIRQVEIRPILYDKSLKGYRKTSLRDQSWKEIATSLGSTVEDCRKRWRSLRDAFAKHFKQGDTSESSKRKKWLFYDQMYFISSYLDYPNTYGENTTDDHIILENEENIEENTTVQYKTETTPNTSHAHQTTEEQTIDVYDENNMKYQEINVTAFTAPESYPVETRKLSPNKTTQEYVTIPTIDPDERFLLSCSPALKRLPSKKNALARLRIQQILYEVEFGDS